MGRGANAPLRNSGLDFVDNLLGIGLLQPALARHPQRHVERGSIIGFVDGEAQNARGKRAKNSQTLNAGRTSAHAKFRDKQPILRQQRALFLGEQLN